MRLLILLLLLFYIVACGQKPLAREGAGGFSAVARPISGGATEAISQATFAQSQEFIAIEGETLNARLEAATREGRAARRAERFWTAYAFDVRPGVAVDPKINQFNGSMQSYGGTSLFFGTSNGMTVETRNLAVFLLHEQSNGAVTRLEVYNLERRREYSGYPVYWLGRAGNEESLNYLRSLVQSHSDRQLAERATVAIGLHDDRRVGAILKDFIRQHAAEKVRQTAIFWLGQVGGEQAFLADLVRNEKESIEVRRQAASAIGASRDGAALSTLQSLYRSVTAREVKEQIISAAARTEPKEAAAGFLTKIVESDSDHQLRKHAVGRLGYLPETINFLASLVRNEREPDELRAEAASAIGKGRSPAAVSTLHNLYRAVANRQVKEQIISAAARTEDKQAIDFLTQIVRSESDLQLRRHAVARLGRLPGTQTLLADLVGNERESVELRREAAVAIGRGEGATALPTLQNLYSAVSTPEVKAEIISAIARSEDVEGAANFLIKLSRGETDRRLKNEAIARLGRLGCQRCVEALNEAINNAAADTETQLQAVNALSRGQSEQAVPLLINVARTHQKPEVRQEAIRRLRHQYDERVQKFLKEVITKQ